MLTNEEMFEMVNDSTTIEIQEMDGSLDPTETHGIVIVEDDFWYYTGTKEECEAELERIVRGSKEYRMFKAAELASDAFWAEIAKNFPEIKTGDFGPEESAAWSQAIARAVETWVTNNTPVKEVIVHDCDLDGGPCYC